MNLTNRSKLRRTPDLGSQDWDTTKQILDAGFLAHVGFCVDGQPFVIPTLYGREGDKLYLHGSAASRMLRQLVSGIPACVTVTLVDGLVLSRSAFRSLDELSLRGCIWNGKEGGRSHRGDPVLASYFRAPHPGPLGGSPRTQRERVEGDNRAEFLIDEASAKVRCGPPPGQRGRLRSASMGWHLTA